MAQPMGPSTAWARNTVGTREQRGTTIMRMDWGVILVKNFSR